MLPNPDHVYAKHLTELGEQTDVLATEDIRTESGIKLLTKGALINRGIRDRLVKHKLLRPIDTQVAVSDAIGPKILVEEARRIMDADSGFAAFMQAFRPKACLSWCLAQIPLPSAMQTKLTIAYTRERALFTHSIRVTIAAVIIADAMGCSDNDVRQIATAALFHDIGVLHIDLQTANANEPLDLDDRKQVYAHPIIGSLILKEICNYPLVISRAVREHHERLDGTGYPKGLAETSLSQMGKILIFTEFAVGVVQKHSYDHLVTILRAYPQRFDKDVVGAFFRLFKELQGDIKASEDAVDAIRLRLYAAELFRGLSSWRELPTANLRPGDREPKQFLDGVLWSIELSISSAGVNLNDLSLDTTELNSQSLDIMELDSLLREAIFQLQRAIHEVYRRWPTLIKPSSEGSGPLGIWLQETNQSLDSIKIRSTELK